jgi:hypothetical protein
MLITVKAATDTFTVVEPAFNTVKSITQTAITCHEGVVTNTADWDCHLLILYVSLSEMFIYQIMRRNRFEYSVTDANNCKTS